MGLIARFLEWIPGIPPEVKGDTGGEQTTAADYLSPIGDDAQPLPEDYFFCVEGVGTGTRAAIGWTDPTDDNRVAAAGEKRIYSRDQNGTAVAEIHLKADGKIAITSIAGTEIDINGVIVSPDGDLTIPGSVTIGGDLSVSGNIDAGGNVAAGGDVTAGSISLTGHTHAYSGTDSGGDTYGGTTDPP